MHKRDILYIVVPCYNEEACLQDTHLKLSTKLSALIKKGSINKNSRIIYVDDGSTDETWQLIKSFRKPSIGLKLSHNRGHQNALLAGLTYASDYSDMIISIDADLQDDIEVIDKMVNLYYEGNEIVYGVRSERNTDSFLKRWTAQTFYKTMSFLGVETIYNSADFRLMSQKAVNELKRYEESNIFLRGIVPSIGFKNTTVEYSRLKRTAGESKYPFKKMLSLALDGITSFSIKPLRLVFLIGVIILLVSIITLLCIVVAKILGNPVEGWAFLSCSVWIVGGVQTISMGILGEYIGKIHAEAKHRPRYSIEEIIKN